MFSVSRSTHSLLVIIALSRSRGNTSGTFRKGSWDWISKKKLEGERKCAWKIRATSLEICQYFLIRNHTKVVQARSFWLDLASQRHIAIKGKGNGHIAPQHIPRMNESFHPSHLPHWRCFRRHDTMQGSASKERDVTTLSISYSGCITWIVTVFKCGINSSGDPSPLCGVSRKSWSNAPTSPVTLEAPWSQIEWDAISNSAFGMPFQHLSTVGEVKVKNWEQRKETKSVTGEGKIGGPYI